MHDHRTPVQVSHASIVPIWPINLDGSCSCGRADCKAAGKHPRHGLAPLQGGGYGILCGAAGPEGSGIFVVDCDEKPMQGVSGLRNFRELCLANGMVDIPDTLVVGTGSGGYHFYFNHPHSRIKNSTSKLAKAVDIRGDGGWVVGPGSPHVSGRPYTVLHEAPIADAPGWLLDWPGLYHGSDPNPGGPGGGGGIEPLAEYVVVPVDMTTEEGQRRLRAYISECRGEVPGLEVAVQGAGGHIALLKAASRGATYWLLPEDVAAQVLWEHYAPRCQPPYTDQYEVYRKVREAIKGVNKPCFGPAPDSWCEGLIKRALIGATDASTPVEGVIDAQRTHVEAEQHPHKHKLRVGDCIAPGKLEAQSTSNVVFQLRRSEEWWGVLQWDEFFDVIRAVNPPVQLEAEKTSLTKADVGAIKIWLEVCRSTTIPTDALRDCVELVAKACRVNPVKDYLLRLPAGDPRIFDELPKRLFGNSADSVLDVEMLKRFLVGAVRRILNPGEQMDNMLVLYGPQGYKKTQFIRALFGLEWSSQQMPDISNKDASHQIATVWGQEIGELDRFLRVDPMTAKDFISRCVDTYRPAYGRDIVHKPRQCVFIGTTNKLEFLRDPTGERRYWIIWVSQVIDLDWVRENRDAIWAAALSLALRPDFEHWINQGSELDTLLCARQAPHVQGDAWQEAVEDYCAGRDWVDPNEIFCKVIMRNDSAWLSKWTNKEKGKINDILTRLGGTKDKRGAVRGFLLPAKFLTIKPSAVELQRRKFAGELEPLKAVG